MKKEDITSIDYKVKEMINHNNKKLIEKSHEISEFLLNKGIEVKIFLTKDTYNFLLDTVDCFSIKNKNIIFSDTYDYLYLSFIEDKEKKNRVYEFSNAGYEELKNTAIELLKEYIKELESSHYYN